MGRFKVGDYITPSKQGPSKAVARVIGIHNTAPVDLEELNTKYYELLIVVSNTKYGHKIGSVITSDTKGCEIACRLVNPAEQILYLPAHLHSDS